MKQWALTYLNKGIHTVPVREKKPFQDGWADKPITVKDIEKWMGEFDLGILTGPVNRLLVLDVDKEGLSQMVGKKLPATPTVKTRNGGYHYYFRWDDRVTEVPTTVQALFGVKGVDVRGKGGQVVAPPSAGYMWMPGRDLSIPIAPPPSWVVDLLLKRNQRSQTLPNQDGAGVGNRHATLVKKVSGYFNQGLTEDDIRPLIEEWNESNTPPLDDKRLERELNSIFKYWRSGHYTSYKTKDLIEAGPMTENETIIDSSSLAAFVSSGSTKIDWIVDRLIPCHGRVLLCGDGGIGKSFIMLDLALEMSRKDKQGLWLGRFPVKQGPVLYIDEESPENLLRWRVNTMAQQKHLPLSQAEFEMSFSQNLAVDDFKSLQALRELLERTEPSLVCIDSLTEIHSVNENDASAMKKVLRKITELSREYQTAFMILDHISKPIVSKDGTVLSPGGPRGTTVKRNWSDATFNVTKENHLMVMKHNKPRFCAPVSPFYLAIEDINGRPSVNYKGEI